MTFSSGSSSTTVVWMRGRLALCMAVLTGLGACSGLERYEPAAPPTGSSADEPAGPETTPAPTEVFVGTSEFEDLRKDGATVVDAREPDEFEAGHIPGAANGPWHMFVDGKNNGLLIDDLDRLGKLVESVGVRSDAPVLVYGRWNEAWGEEGRIFWMLEYLGHRDVRVLEGGYEKWLATGAKPSKDREQAPVGNFPLTPRPELRATAAEIEAELAKDNVVIVDIRELDEYEGETPYGSARGGHIPRAVHFRWLDVFSASGTLLPAAEIRSRFSALGIDEDSVVIAYCTGGIRSGFIYTVMRWAGYTHPRNYDGSWWEWSGQPELAIEH